MIAVDTNILVYAHRRDAAWHKKAATLIAGLAGAKTPWALPWPCLHEFIAIVTKRIYLPPSPLGVAVDQIEAWLESPSVLLLAETDEHWPALKTGMTSARIAGGAVHDARIVALCAQHGVSELWSADRDFSRFAEIKVRNPLV